MKNGSYCCWISVLWSCENLVSTDEILVEILWKSRVILVGFLCFSCENPVYARGLLWGNTGRLCLQEITFGILKSTMGCPRTLVPQRFPDITSDNHTLSERITCSLLKPQVSICAYTVESIAITYVLVVWIPSKHICFHAVLLLFPFWACVGSCWILLFSVR